MKRFLKSFHYGNKGFTLIELLVVVAILGVLAAVIVPNVARFIGSGTVQAANTEAHDVQTAVVAYMAENNLAIYDGGDIGPEASSPVDAFLVNPSGLQAVYTIGTDGTITDAVAVEDGKYKDLTYAPATGWVPTTA